MANIKAVNTDVMAEASTCAKGRVFRCMRRSLLMLCVLRVLLQVEVGLLEEAGSFAEAR